MGVFVMGIDRQLLQFIQISYYFITTLVGNLNIIPRENLPFYLPCATETVSSVFF
jgi:hypothetical protein